MQPHEKSLCLLKSGKGRCPSQGIPLLRLVKGNCSLYVCCSIIVIVGGYSPFSKVFFRFSNSLAKSAAISTLMASSSSIMGMSIIIFLYFLIKLVRTLWVSRGFCRSNSDMFIFRFEVFIYAVYFLYYEFHIFKFSV